MNSQKSPLDFSARQKGYFALLLWGVAIALLLRHDPFGVNESAARSLLLSWSIADQVANSVVTFGMPDLRILLFLPVGFMWTGSVFAAKVLSAAVLAVAGWLLHDWAKRSLGSEGALLATGLLLISPLALAQIDAVGVGVYLLAAFVVGAWLDTQYRANPKPFNGWYFAQLIACAFSVSLHPAGLAYPLALLLSWRTMPHSAKHRWYFVGAAVFACTFVLYERAGWGGAAWLQNPLTGLGAVFTGPMTDDDAGVMAWLPGAAFLVVTAAVVLFRHKALWEDLLGRTLLIGLLVGATQGDEAWALLALAIVLYFGLPALLRSAQPGSEGGFLRQRGWVLLLLFACSTIFMRADKAYYETSHGGALSAQDQLIKALAVAADDERKAAEGDDNQHQRNRFVVASEWPGRTMLACRCDTVTLPPVQRDPEAQMAMLHGITHLLLDPKRTANVDLARNLALLGGPVETLALQPGGVLLHVKETPEPRPDERKPQ